MPRSSVPENIFNRTLPNIAAGPGLGSAGFSGNAVGPVGGFMDLVLNPPGGRLPGSVQPMFTGTGAGITPASTRNNPLESAPAPIPVGGRNLTGFGRQFGPTTGGGFGIPGFTLPGTNQFPSSTPQGPNPPATGRNNPPGDRGSRSNITPSSDFDDFSARMADMIAQITGAQLANNQGTGAGSKPGVPPPQQSPSKGGFQQQQPPPKGGFNSGFQQQPPPKGGFNPGFQQAPSPFGDLGASIGGLLNNQTTIEQLLGSLLANQGNPQGGQGFFPGGGQGAFFNPMQFGSFGGGGSGGFSPFGGFSGGFNPYARPFPTGSIAPLFG